MKDKYFYLTMALILPFIILISVAAYFFLSCEEQTIVYRAIILLVAIGNVAAIIFVIKFCKEYFLCFMFFISFMYLAIAWEASGSKEYNCKKLRHYRSL